jgi:hypothetical protein
MTQLGERLIAAAKDALKHPHIVTGTDGSRTHYLGEVSMALELPQAPPATKGE